MRVSAATGVVVSMLSVSLLSACGGGGGTHQKQGTDAISLDPASLPAAGVLVVNASKGSIPVGNHDLNTVYKGASETFDVLGSTIEAIHPDSANFDSTMLFSQSDPKKFMLWLYDNVSSTESTYGCRSSAWTTAELNALGQWLGNPALTTLPTCSSGVSIDAAKHQLQFTKLVLENIKSPGSAITVSANVSWALPTAPDSEGLMVIDANNGTIAAGTYTLAAKGGSAGSSQILGTQINYTFPKNPFFDSGFLLAADDPKKFLVWLHDNLKSPYPNYGCRGEAWTPAELLALGDTLHYPGIVFTPICSSAVTVNSATQTIEFKQLALPDLDSPGRSVTVSAKVSMEMNQGVVITDVTTGTAGTASISASPTP